LRVGIWPGQALTKTKCEGGFIGTRHFGCGIVLIHL
jgi:hypothetical protein